MKRPNGLHIGLLLGIWALAQLAVIDHIYSDAHNNDEVCEWCTNHTNVKDKLITSDVKPTPVVFSFFIPSPQVSLAQFSNSTLRPPTRAPPTSIFV